MSCYSLPRHIDVRAARNRELATLETRRAVNATIRRFEALEEASTATSCDDLHYTAPLRLSRDTTKWVENTQLICWVTQQLGGTWPARGGDMGQTNVNQSATPRRVFGDANGQTCPDESTAASGNICGESSLPHELLNPQARDALTALSENEYDSSTLNSDVILGILNAGPAPGGTVDVATIFGSETHARDTATGGEDSWMAGLLSDQAREGLAALERYGGMVDDSDVLLNILNAGSVQGVSNQEACATLSMDGVGDSEAAIAELIEAGFAALKARSAYGGNQGASPNASSGPLDAKMEATVENDASDWEAELFSRARFTNTLNEVLHNALVEMHELPRLIDQHQYMEGYSTDGATGLPLSPFWHTHASSQTSLNAPRLDDLWDFGYSQPPLATTLPFIFGWHAEGGDGFVDWTEDCEESDDERPRYSDREDVEDDDDDSDGSIFLSPYWL